MTKNDPSVLVFASVHFYVGFLKEPIINLLKFKMAHGCHIENRFWPYFLFSYCVLGFDERRLSYRLRYTCVFQKSPGFIQEMTSVPDVSRSTVLDPTLFNPYITDLPVTSCASSFMQTTCALQGKAFAEIECTLSADITHMAEYCRRWRLKPSTTKTITSVFHLHNACASRELAVSMDGQLLKHNSRGVSRNMDYGGVKG